MSKMKVQDATKELSRRAAKLLGDVTGVRTAAEKTLAELRKIESGFTQQQEAEREEKRREEQQKALSSQSKAWTMPDDVPEEKKEEKIYTIGETVTYTKNSKDLIHFTVDSVRNTDDRNEFADSQPEQVIIIHYSYENIANEDDIYFSSINFKVIDEGGNVCETYPASIDTYPQTAPIGTKSEGEEAYGLKQQSSKIKLIVELDYSGTKATYELPIQ